MAICRLPWQNLLISSKGSFSPLSMLGIKFPTCPIRLNKTNLCFSVALFVTFYKQNLYLILIVKRCSTDARYGKKYTTVKPFPTESRFWCWLSYADYKYICTTQKWPPAKCTNIFVIFEFCEDIVYFHNMNYWHLY